MRHLFAGWQGVEKKLCAAGHILLCLDFDGTLSPIKPRPKDAELGAPVKGLLRKLAGNNFFSPAVISGRSLRDIRRKIGIKGLVYAGNHGLEIDSRNKRFIQPQARRFMPAVSKIAAALKIGLKPFPEAVLEHKRLSLSLHYRLVRQEKLPRLREVFQQISRPYIAAKRVNLTLGKKVWEIRPPIDWDKGRAVLWLVQRMKSGRTLAVFVGDDVTDEDAFRAVNRIGGISILVGRRKSSRAKYYLKSPKEVEKFLGRVSEMRMETASSR